LNTCISGKKKVGSELIEEKKMRCSTKSIFDRPHVLFNLVSSLLEVSLLKVA